KASLKVERCGLKFLMGWSVGDVGRGRTRLVLRKGGGRTFSDPNRPPHLRSQTRGRSIKRPRTPRSTLRNESIGHLIAEVRCRLTHGFNGDSIPLNAYGRELRRV